MSDENNKCCGLCRWPLRPGWEVEVPGKGLCHDSCAAKYKAPEEEDGDAVADLMQEGGDIGEYDSPCIEDGIPERPDIERMKREWGGNSQVAALIEWIIFIENCNHWYREQLKE